MITIKNISSTLLNYDGFRFVVKRYSEELLLKKDIVISFDKRMTRVQGLYFFNTTKDMHHIQISPFCEKIKDSVASRYLMISTVLHELKHAQQRESSLPRSWGSLHLDFNPDIKNKELSDWFSVSETNARVFENLHLHEAVETYNLGCI